MHIEEKGGGKWDGVGGVANVGGRGLTGERKRHLLTGGFSR